MTMADEGDDTTTGGPDGESEELRKVLRGLPRAKASADFEQRLARRRARHGTAGERILRHFSPAGRIPAPAYSAAALLILGVAAYYAFFRSGNVPVPGAP